MQPINQLFKIWIANDASGSDWELVSTTADLEQAAAFFERQWNAGAHVAIYERGRYYDGARLKTDFIGFAWSSNLNDYMEGKPIGRGHGWTEDDLFVQYELPAESNQQVDLGPDAEAAGPWAAAPTIYEEQGQCQHCGRLTPISCLKWLSHDVQTGHSSGVHRHSRSYSTTTSSRGVSDTTRRSSGYTSGRRYYRREEVLLCEECYDRQVGADRGQMVKGFLMNLLGF